MLEGHPALFSPPELHLLPFGTMAQRRDALGASFMGEGLRRAWMELEGIDAAASQLRLDALTDRDALIHEVYARLQTLAAPRLLVDKTPSYAGRLDTLERAEETFHAARYIHLVRHPHAMIESFVRMRMEKLLGASGSDPHRLAERIWVETNQNVQKFFAKVDPQRCLVVRYEDLVANPRATSERICAFLDVPFDPALLDPYSEGRMTGGVHGGSAGIDDPNFLRHRTIDASLGDAWRSVQLPRPLGDRAAALARSFGYELPGTAKPARPAMRERFVEVRGMSLCQASWGPEQGRPIVCVHGILEQAASWGLVAEPLAELGFRVEAPDLRGHGRSAHVEPGGAYHLIDLLGDLDALTAAIPAPFALVGHSMGGILAALLAATRPERVSNLMLIEMPLPAASRPGRAAARIAAHLDYLRSPPRHPVLADLDAAARRLRRGAASLSPDRAAILAERGTRPVEGGLTWRWDPRIRSRAGLDSAGLEPERFLETLAGIAAPITLIYGDSSGLGTDQATRSVREALPGAAFQVVAGGHNLPFDAPEAIVEAIRGILVRS